MRCGSSQQFRRLPRRLGKQDLRRRHCRRRRRICLCRQLEREAGVPPHLAARRQQFPHSKQWSRLCWSSRSRPAFQSIHERFQPRPGSGRYQLPVRCGTIGCEILILFGSLRNPKPRQCPGLFVSFTAVSKPRTSSTPRRTAGMTWLDAVSALHACSLPANRYRQNKAVPGGFLMRFSSIHLRAVALGAAAALWLAGSAQAAEVHVMISGGLSAAYNALVPEFEKATGNKVITAYGPSMGTTVNAIPMRLERGEAADVLILVGYALDDLIKKGKASDRVDLVNSKIGVAVKAGAPKPDISSADAVKRALLAAKTVAYSDSASGVYISTEMFDKLGIAAEMKEKARNFPATPVAEIVARGEAELGFQQISELKPIPGIDIVGPLPENLQKVTVFSAGIATVSKEPEAGKALIKSLASPGARETIVNSGLEPIEGAGK